MTFSAYQIESFLNDLRKQTFSLENTYSENVTLSKDSLENSRQYFKPAVAKNIGFVTPQNILSLIEDLSEIDPTQNYEQQRRAGRFVYPPYVPENPSPPFSLVTDYVQAFRKSNEQEPVQESAEPSEVVSTKPSVINDESTPKSDNIDSLVLEPETIDLEPEPMQLDFMLEPEAMEDAPRTLSLDGETVEKVEVPMDEDADKSSSEKTVAESQDTSKEKESKVPPPEPEKITAALLLDEIEDDDEDDDLDDMDDGLRGEATDESDVVFGSGNITPKSMVVFVDKFPDSAIKFLLRRNLDGRPVPAEFDEIYKTWEERGLLRGRLKKYIMKVMDWKELPDIAIHELVQKLREILFEIREKKL